MLLLHPNTLTISFGLCDAYPLSRKTDVEQDVREEEEEAEIRGIGPSI